jgi:hypothetical protein
MISSLNFCAHTFLEGQEVFKIVFFPPLLFVSEMQIVDLSLAWVKKKRNCDEDSEGAATKTICMKTASCERLQGLFFDRMDLETFSSLTMSAIASAGLDRGRAVQLGESKEAAYVK